MLCVLCHCTLQPSLQDRHAAGIRLRDTGLDDHIFGSGNVPDLFRARDGQSAPHIILPRRCRRGSRPPAGYVSVAELAARAQSAKSVLYRDIERSWLRCYLWRGKKCIAEADAIAWLSPQVVEPEAPALNAGIPAAKKKITDA